MKQFFFFFILLVLADDQCAQCVTGEITDSCEERCFKYIVEKIKHDDDDDYKPIPNEDLMDFCIDNSVLDSDMCCDLYQNENGDCGSDSYSFTFKPFVLKPYPFWKEEDPQMCFKVYILESSGFTPGEIVYL